MPMPKEICLASMCRAQEEIDAARGHLAEAIRFCGVIVELAIEDRNIPRAERYALKLQEPQRKLDSIKSG